MANSETKSKGMIEVKFDEYLALKNESSNKDQTIGSQKETIRILKNTIEEGKQDKEATEKVKIITKTKLQNGLFSPNTTETSITYKNLEDVKQELREELEKELKIDNKALDKKVLDLNLELEKSKESYTRLSKRTAEDITAAKSKMREAHNHETEALQKTINELKNDKTAEQREQKRKEEIKALHDRISDLEAELKGLDKMSWLQRIIWNKTKREAINKQIAKERDTLNRMKKNEGSWRTTSSSYIYSY